MKLKKLKKLKKLVIYVTQKDIKQGTKWCAGSCPVALSMRRRGLRAFVLGGYWKKSMLGGLYHPLPQSVENFVDAFDRGWSVNPFHFTVTL